MSDLDRRPANGLHIRTLPRPRFVALTDRSDGTVWFMTHLQAENRWGITDQVPPGWFGSDIVVYTAMDGPCYVFGSFCVRMLLRSHRLGYEVIDGKVNSAPLRTRILNYLYFLNLDGLGFKNPGDTMGYLVEQPSD